MSRSTMRAPNARATSATAGTTGKTNSARATTASQPDAGRGSGSASATSQRTSKSAAAAARLPAKPTGRSASGKSVIASATKSALRGTVKSSAQSAAGKSTPAAAKSATKPAGRAGRPVAPVVPATLIAGRPIDTMLTTSSSGKPILRPTLKVETAVAPKKGKKSNEPLPFHLRPIDELWREYRGLPTKELRNFLIEKYLELVRFTAERMHMKLPSEVEVDDLMSAGLFGLMDAIDAFDPDRGVKFETYCTQRIRGAIFDELRAMDWVPRLVRSRTAKVEKVRKQVEMETGRKATDAEIADRLKVEKGEFEKLQKDSRPVGVVSLNRKWFETDSSKDVREIDVIRDSKQESPVQQIQRQDLQTLITKGLSRAERLIVILYYYEEMTMKEIGTTLDLSESRVSQMHSSILARLKAQMQHREKDMEEA
jgi:RNA polymerase sigma factor for flagellar operon FliA